MRILIKSGRVIDPASGFDKVCDIALAAGRVRSEAAASCANSLANMTRSLHSGRADVAVRSGSLRAGAAANAGSVPCRAVGCGPRQY